MMTTMLLMMIMAMVAKVMMVMVMMVTVMTVTLSWKRHYPLPPAPFLPHPLPPPFPSPPFLLPLPPPFLHPHHLTSPLLPPASPFLPFLPPPPPPPSAWPLTVFISGHHDRFADVSLADCGEAQYPYRVLRVDPQVWQNGRRVLRGHVLSEKRQCGKK